jgi:hypothetical protein
VTRPHYLYSYKSILTQEKDAVVIRLKEKIYKEKRVKIVVGIKIQETTSTISTVTPSPKRRKV